MTLLIKYDNVGHVGLSRFIPQSSLAFRQVARGGGAKDTAVPLRAKIRSRSSRSSRSGLGFQLRCQWKATGKNKHWKRNKRTEKELTKWWF